MEKDKSNTQKLKDAIDEKAVMDKQDFDYTYVTAEGAEHFVPENQHPADTNQLKYYMNDEDFNNKLHHESYSGAYRTVKHDDSEPIHKKSSNVLLIILASIIIGIFSGIGYKLTDHYILGNRSEVSIKYVPEFEQVTSIKEFDQSSNTVSEIAQKLEASVVAITNKSIQNSLWGETLGTSSGSGVIFDITTEHVYILTNHHVIENSDALHVNFFNDKNYPGTIIGSDPDSDLAVVTVKKSDIPIEIFQKIRKVTLGDSDEIEVGEMAVAIGNPLGYNNTVTVGVISAVDRFISDDLNTLSLIQTDAAINPGNSGGALVNAYGELIGINTIKISDTAVEGIGFAIPINSAVPILEDLITKGYVSRPFIGIYGRDVTEELAEMYDIPVGVFVSDVIPETPAFKSGLKKYDIIVDIEGMPITTMGTLNKAINQFNVDDIVNIKIMRETDSGFEAKSLKIKIGDRHDY